MVRGIHQMQMEDTVKDLACNILYYNTIVLLLPTVFSTVTCCTVL